MLKSAVLQLLVKSDAFAPVRFLNRSKTPILMYHRFSNADSAATTSQATLIRHIKYLKKNYKIISLADLAARLKKGDSVPARSAVITIDDGYSDAFEIAFPVLREYGAPATLFVVTDFVDQKCWMWTDKARYVLSNSQREKLRVTVGPKPFDLHLNGNQSRLESATKVNAELKKLPAKDRDGEIEKIAATAGVAIPDLPPTEFGAFTWENAREMDNSVISIESHTVTHPVLTNSSDSELEYELTRSRAVLEEKLQRPSRLFCYPNGNQGERERSAVSSADYDCAVSTELRLATSDDNIVCLPRVDAESDLTRFAQAVTGFDELKLHFRR